MSFNLGTAEGRIVIDGSGAQKGFAVATAAAEGFFSVIKSKLNSVEQLSENLIKVGASGGVGIGAAVKAAASFEQGLSNIKAVSGATAKEMDGIRTTALRLGKDTVFSATEAASAMEALIKAGVSTQDVMTGAADATVNLAAAGGVDLTEAAEIAANALNNFNLQGKDMEEVTDLIAGAANASAIDVHDFGFSLSQAGAVANLSGLQFKDLAVAIAEMGQAGIKGSDAGTSIKTFLTNLIPTMDKQKALFKELGLLTINEGKSLQFLASKGIKPADTSYKGLSEALGKYVASQGGAKEGTAANAKQAQDLAQKLGLMQNAFFNAKGEIKSFAEIQEVLKNATKGMTREQKLATLETLFGSDAIRAAAVFADEGAAGYDKMAASMGKVTAADVAATRLDNLNGSIEQLKGSFETMAITIGTVFLPLVRKIVDGLTTMINMFNNLPPGLQKAIAVMIGLGSASALLTGIFVKLLFVLTPLLARFLGFAALKQVFSIFVVGFKALRGGQGVMAALALTAGRTGVVFTRFQKIGKVLLGFLVRFPRVLMALRAAWVFAFGPWGVVIAAVIAAVVILYKKFKPFHDLVNKIASAIRDGFVSALDAVKAAWDAVVEGFRDAEGHGSGPAEFFLRIGDAARTVWEALKSLVDLFMTEVVPVLVSSGKEIGAQLLTSWREISDLFVNTVVPAATDLAQTFVDDLLPALQDLWTAIQPVVVAMVKWTVAMQVGLLIALFKVAQFIIKYVLPATIKLNVMFVQVLVKAITILIKYIVFINAAWIEFTRILVEVVIAVVKTFVSIWTTTWQIVVAVITTVVNAIIATVKWLASTFMSIWSSLWNGPIGQLVRAAMELVKLIIQVVAVAILVIVTNFLDQMYKMYKTVFDAIKNVVVAVFNFLKPFIVGALNFIKNTTITIWNAIKSVTLAAWRLFQQYVLGPVTAVYNKVKSILSSILGAIRGAFGSANSQASSSWRGFYNIIKGWIDNVLNIVRGIKGRITGALSGAGSWLYNAGRNIIKGLLNGINSMIGSVRSALGGLTNLIPSWKGPESVDKKLLTKNGIMIMQSLLRGLESEFPAIRSMLSDVTTAIPSTVGVDVVRRGVTDSVGRRTPPAWAVQGMANAGHNIYNNWTVNNPVAEKTSTTTVREATRRASLGMVA